MKPPYLALISPSGTSLLIGKGSAHYSLGDETELSPAGQSVVREDLPATTGGTVTPGRKTVREMSLSVLVRGSSEEEIQERIDTLYEVLGDHGPDLVTLRYPWAGTVRELYVTAEGAPSEESEGYFTLVTVTLTAEDPISVSATEKTVALPGTATNAGNAETWPIVDLTVTEGTVQGFRLQNAKTGLRTEVAGISAGVGSQIRVVMRPGYEQITVNGVSAMSKRTPESLPFAIRPGGNGLSVTVTAGGGSVSAVATYRDGWSK